MAEPNVLLNVDGPMATITLNRPRVLNAQNEALADDLATAVDTVARMPDLRVVVVRGAGRAFSAGLDLNMRGDMHAHGNSLSFFERQEQTRVRLESLDAITVAAIHGYCLGGGLQLAIACDIRVASSDARLGLPAALEGLFPGLATVRLPRLIGLGPARRLILSGELVEAPEALRLGLVDHLVPADRFEAGLAEVLQTYQRVPPAAAAASKALLRGAFDPPPAAAIPRLSPLMAACLSSPEAEAAISAWRARKST
jgi:enoyl-CoA hydratase/carnithine racemase